jgi:hypothetical protein
MREIESHPSLLDLDRHLMGALQDLGGEEVNAHIDGCVACQHRLQAERALGEQYLTWLPREQDLLRRARSAPPARAPRRLTVIGLSAAVAAALVLVVTWRAHWAPDGGPHDRIKGGSLMEVVVQRDQATAPFEGQPLQQGDVLAFRYSSQRRYLLMATLEARGKVQVFYPPDGAQSAPIAAGAKIKLKRGLQLDAYPGPERIVALFSDLPLRAEVVERALLERLQALRGDPRRQLAIDRLALPCDQVSWLIEKARP